MVVPGNDACQCEGPRQVLSDNMSAVAFQSPVVLEALKPGALRRWGTSPVPFSVCVVCMPCIARLNSAAHTTHNSRSTCTGPSQISGRSAKKQIVRRLQRVPFFCSLSEDVFDASLYTQVTRESRSVMCATCVLLCGLQTAGVAVVAGCLAH